MNIQLFQDSKSPENVLQLDHLRQNFGSLPSSCWPLVWKLSVTYTTTGGYSLPQLVRCTGRTDWGGQLSLLRQLPLIHLPMASFQSILTSSLMFSVSLWSICHSLLPDFHFTMFLRDSENKTHIRLCLSRNCSYDSVLVYFKIYKFIIRR